VGNIIYNGYGKFFCFIIENNNRELPQLVVYDVRKVFPEFEKYYQHQQDIANHLQQIDGRVIRLLTEDPAEKETQKKKSKMLQSMQTINVL
jgi:hypothetical protein